MLLRLVVHVFLTTASGAASATTATAAAAISSNVSAISTGDAASAHEITSSRFGGPQLTHVQQKYQRRSFGSETVAHS